MKVYKTRKGPLKEAIFLSQDEMDALCENALLSTGLLPKNPEPIRIDRFIEKKFKIDVTYLDLPQGVLGYTKFSPNGVEEITIDKSFDNIGTVVAERRMRTTLAHEAGHGLIHASLFAVQNDTKTIFGDKYDGTPRIMCRDINDSSSSTPKKGEWYQVSATTDADGTGIPVIGWVSQTLFVPEKLSPIVVNGGESTSTITSVEVKKSPPSAIEKILDATNTKQNETLNKGFIHKIWQKILGWF